MFGASDLLSLACMRVRNIARQSTMRKSTEGDQSWSTYAEKQERAQPSGRLHHCRLRVSPIEYDVDGVTFSIKRRHIEPISRAVRVQISNRGIKICFPVLHCGVKLNDSVGSPGLPEHGRRQQHRARAYCQSNQSN